jgi:hypothetical protein
VTPMMLAQTWIDQNDPHFDPSTCAFPASDAEHVDEVYEFVLPFPIAFLSNEQIYFQSGDHFHTRNVATIFIRETWRPFSYAKQVAW